MENFYNCKCLRKKKLALLFDLWYHIFSIFNLEQSHVKKNNQSYFFWIFPFMDTAHTFTHGLDNLGFGTWYGLGNYYRVCHRLLHIQANSLALNIHNRLKELLWVPYFLFKKSTRMSRAASASISPLTPYSSNPRSASLVESRSSWDVIGRGVSFESLSIKSVTRLPCLDIVPSIL